MAEYHPDFDNKNIAPMPKDPEVEDNALRTIMSLAVFGAGIKAGQDGTDPHKAISDCMKLFKDAGFIH